jgi:succinyl-CoA synthetase beta subunit
MKIHEYQGKAILRNYGVPVPQGEVATSPQEARRIAEALPADTWVVKSQIHAGGRGKGGGIRLATSPLEVEAIAAELLGRCLVTKQTGPEGRLVQRVLVEQGCEISREFYCSVLIDRTVGKPLVLVSPAGGMNIEEVAAATPEKIFIVHVDILLGLAAFQVRQLVEHLQIEPALHSPLASLFQKLYTVFREQDCSLLEVNPLVLTKTGTPLVLDVKMQFDDNALFRHPESVLLRDFAEEEPLEVEAAKYKLNYIKLSGNIGCIVNGAGLAMATMDLITLAGASPANFLDVGGGASALVVENALRLLMADPDVQAVLINVFGGILRCDVFAQGVVQAVANVQVTVPVVVRMAGTNVEEGQRILTDSGLNFLVADGMADAAQKIIQALGMGARP